MTKTQRQSQSPNRLDALELEEYGGARIQNNVIAVDSIQDMLDLPAGYRREDLQVNVKGYYPDSDKGGGQFYWDASNEDDDDGGITFEVSGVSVGRWKRIIPGYIQPEFFGAVGDGVSDDADAIEACFNSSLGYTPLLSGVYEVGRTVVCKSPVRISGVTDKAEIKSDSLESDEMLIFQGVEGDDVSALQDINKGDVNIELSSISGFLVGDWIKIKADNQSAAGQHMVGEIQQITDISGSFIEIAEGVFDDYSTSENARISKIEMIDGVSAEYIKFTGSGKDTGSQYPGVLVDKCMNVSIKSCIFSKFGLSCLWTADSIFGTVEKCEFRDTEMYTLGYAILNTQASQWWSIDNNWCSFVGKLWDCGGGGSRHGLSRFIDVRNNDIYNHGRNSGISTHEAGEFIRIRKNNIYSDKGTSSSIFTRGANIEVSDNFCTGSSGAAIDCTTRGRSGYIKVLNNKVQNCGSHLVNVTHGEDSEGRQGDVQITISGNESLDVMGSRGVQIVNFSSSTPTKRYRVVNNVLNSSDEAVYIRAIGSGFEQGVISGNEVMNERGNGAIVLRNEGGGDVSKTIISGNNVEFANRGIRYLGDSSGIGCYVAGNIIHAGTNQIDGFDQDDVGDNRLL